ncbi:hypothetical protein G6553_02420 [Nocardioides sp. IC4_145]|uniref:hypothetical protein n=1 Tax=Nocardioides sp. IC4_145 TaxID=2714037 RepID=UPI00140780C0|nr:hypothetical protein [Nocardioides sp. IC4_145]NHC22029.1 hypothetical protein [Nocardioides sp. IC4_145]
MAEAVAPTLDITVERELDDETIAAYWALYRETFAELEVRAMARHLLHEHEFVEEMKDARVMKYVARDAAGEVVGLSTLTRDLETVPWISPGWWAHHYPEHTARNAVYYLGFTLVRHDQRQTNVMWSMISTIVEMLVEERAVCGYDYCKFNNEVLNLGPGTEALLHRIADVEVDAADTQTYYRALFAGPRTS